MVADDRPSVLRGSDWASSLAVEVEVEVEVECSSLSLGAYVAGIGRRAEGDGVSHVMK